MDFFGFLSTYSIIKFVIMILAFLIAIVGHEIMHGYVAFLYGDDTAKKMGRLSINPIKHIDLVGSVLIPLVLIFLNAPFLFGWAKPVPIDMRFLIEKWGYNAGIAVSLAGVAYNLVFAFVLSGILFSGIFGGNIGHWAEILVFFLVQLVIYNVVLGVFNLWPIPPLDGYRALSFICLKFGFESIARWFFQIEAYGMIIIVIILATPLSQVFFYPIRFLLQFLLV